MGARRGLALPRWLKGLRTRRAVAVPDAPRAVALRGTLWTPDGVQPDRLVLVGDTGVVERVEPWPGQAPAGVPVVDAPWIGPGVSDRHVHLGAQECLTGGVVEARVLGAAGAVARGDRLRSAGAVVGAAAGPAHRGDVIDLAGVERARAVVAELVADGADVLCVALDRVDGVLVPDAASLGALVIAAHDAGLPVVALAPDADLVARALEAGVDELGQCPTELLPPELVDAIAAAGVEVVGTLQSSSGTREVLTNASRLVSAGVLLSYGTDAGAPGSITGVDPRELERLASAGLGRAGALTAAVRGAQVAVGHAGGVVGLSEDPLGEPAAWRSPLVVALGGTVTLASAEDPVGTRGLVRS